MCQCAIPPIYAYARDNLPFAGAYNASRWLYTRTYARDSGAWHPCPTTFFRYIAQSAQYQHCFYHVLCHSNPGSPLAHPGTRRFKAKKAGSRVCGGCARLRVVTHSRICHNSRRQPSFVTQFRNLSQMAMDWASGLDCLASMADRAPR